MKRLIFMRHGKSSWEHDVVDSKRPLKSRGEIDAKNVSIKFKSLNISIDAIYSSPANRALSTAHIFADIMDVNTQDINIENDLYDFSGYMVKSVINTFPNSANHIIIFGHNHAFTSLVNLFGDRYIDNLPTCGLAVVYFEENDWSEISHGITELILIPKDLR